MAAGVSDTRERVVFRVEIDQSSARSTDCFEGSIQAISMAGNCEPLLLEEIADGIVGSVFFIGELRVGPNLGQFRRESNHPNETYGLEALSGLQLTS